ncbi:hypothetical protein A2707_03900 [Candidatus Saccharibacteria bacterium RIFCSPHIGHO2_01_FULL_45_15]|nr:MAG: hypothetical protein A2707_03900 [Candidatus Saccharibacteria bacterium RIFCSPHIGHO2_01_FULL_45_15]OGL31584.1 MAG: hypothetical protein A3E76_02520 [Candidatus Saccharibacteria bacterium RIFCSPHIGHO2_12_FULL_44_22]
MKTNTPDNCGNSPRSVLAIEVAVNLASSEYDKLEPLLAEDFTWSVAGSDEEILKPKLKSYMNKANQSDVHIDRFDVLTSISHGKYAAVSSCAYASNGYIFNSHDLYEFTGAGGSAKLLKVTSYIVDSKQ